MFFEAVYGSTVRSPLAIPDKQKEAAGPSSKSTSKFLIKITFSRSNYE